jgi:hypothetical protein
MGIWAGVTYRVCDGESELICGLTRRRVQSISRLAKVLSESVVQRRPENRCYKMGEVRRTFVELKVARDTVIGEIFCYAGFGDA